jgi:glycosyltransferase involved in cell wall biosynthesis
VRILFLSQYFPPEIEPSAGKVCDLSRNLAARGHEVTVITGFPNYPTGIMPREYKNRLLAEETVDNVRVLRTFLITSPNRGFTRRMVGGSSFMCSSTLRSIFAGPSDVVITSSPPLEIGLAGYLVSRLRSVPFVFEVRDVWPMAAIVLGVIRNRVVIRLAQSVERFIYSNADHIVAVTDGVRQHVLELGVDESMTTLIKNGVDTDIFRPLDRYSPLRQQLGLNGKFVCIYTGTHGLQANLSAVLQAAALLKPDPDIAFLFVGDGAEKPKLRQIKQEQSLSNVIFLDPQPRELIPHLISLADVGLVHTRSEAFFEGYLPVKMFEYMACGCPVVVANNGEARQLVEEARAGVWAEPGNPSSLADTLRGLRADPAWRAQLGANGAQYAAHNLSRDMLAAQYERLLAAVIGR